MFQYCGCCNCHKDEVNLASFTNWGLIKILDIVQFFVIADVSFLSLTFAFVVHVGSVLTLRFITLVF